jgi:uncharacterized UPF0160 family protein
MEVVGDEWRYQVKKVVKIWYPARPIVEAALKSRFEFHESGKIIKLGQMCPWKDHLYELEKEHQCEEILFVLFEGVDDFRV